MKYNTNIIQLWYNLCRVNYVSIVCILFCIFVSQESFGRIPKQITYDKSLPKGNKSERLVSQFLELSCNPKGKLAYKHFLTMQEKKNFVAVSTYANVTPIPQTVLHTTEEFYNRFLDLLNASTTKKAAFIKVSIEYFSQNDEFKFSSYSNFKKAVYGKV